MRFLFVILVFVVAVAVVAVFGGGGGDCEAANEAVKARMECDQRPAFMSLLHINQTKSCSNCLTSACKIIQ